MGEGLSLARLLESGYISLLHLGNVESIMYFILQNIYKCIFN
jgi:hypothetical protein